MTTMSCDAPITANHLFYKNINDLLVSTYKWISSKGSSIYEKKNAREFILDQIKLYTISFSLDMS